MKITAIVLSGVALLATAEAGIRANHRGGMSFKRDAEAKPWGLEFQRRGSMITKREARPFGYKTGYDGSPVAVDDHEKRGAGSIIRNRRRGLNIRNSEAKDQHPDFERNYRGIMIAERYADVEEGNEHIGFQRNHRGGMITKRDALEDVEVSD